MDFGGVLENILNSYGVIGLIIVILIILSIISLPVILNKTLDKNNNKLSNSVTTGMQTIATQLTNGISSQNELLIATLSNNQEKMLNNQNELFKHLIDMHTADNKKEEEHAQGIEKRQSNSSVLNSLIHECIDIYKCKRACIVEFHNSKENLNGLPFLWYDIQYEAVDVGIKSISHKCKDQQYSIISPLVDLLYTVDNNKVILKGEELYNIKSSVFTEHMRELNNQGLVVIGLWNTENKLAGLLVLEYSTPEIPDCVNEAGIISLSSWMSKLLTKDILLN